jgi:hypothetical protein
VTFLATFAGAFLGTAAFFTGASFSTLASALARVTFLATFAGAFLGTAAFFTGASFSTLAGLSAFFFESVFLADLSSLNAIHQ